MLSVYIIVFYIFKKIPLINILHSSSYGPGVAREEATMSVYNKIKKYIFFVIIYAITLRTSASGVTRDPVG